MEIASLIMSIIALIFSIANMVWLLAKHFSSHSIQYVPAPSMGQDPLSEIMGKDPRKEFRELGEPLDDDELSYIDDMKKRKLKLG